MSNPFYSDRVYDPSHLPEAPRADMARAHSSVPVGDQMLVQALRAEAARIEREHEPVRFNVAFTLLGLAADAIEEKREKATADRLALDAIVEAFKAGRPGPRRQTYAELLDEIEAAIRTSGRVV